MNNHIMRDNLVYFNEWSKLNPNLKDNLEINGNYLIYKGSNEEEQIDISRFYLPEMLFNENFRRKLLNEYTSKDFFEIVCVYVNANDIYEKRTTPDFLPPTLITEVTSKIDNNTSYLYIKTNDNRSFRIKISNPEKYIMLFEEFTKLNGFISLKDFERMINNAK